MAVVNPYNYGNIKGRAGQVKRHTTVRPIRSGQDKQVGGGNRTDQYLESQVMTASPEELTLMLYEGAVKFIKQARVFNEESAIEKTSNAILRAQAIYSELRSTLNMDYEISTQLDGLYAYILNRLMLANIGKDSEILDEVLGLSEEFRDTWKSAMKHAGK